MWNDKILSDESTLKLGRFFSWLGRWSMVAAMLIGFGTAVLVTLATRGTAEVVWTAECRGTGKYKRTCPLSLELEVADGLRVLRHVNFGRPLRVGDRIDVLYLEVRPRNFVVRSYAGIFAIPVILLFLGSILLLAGWVHEVTAWHEIRRNETEVPKG